MKRYIFSLMMLTAVAAQMNAAEVAPKVAPKPATPQAAPAAEPVVVEKEKLEDATGAKATQAQKDKAAEKAKALLAIFKK